MNFSRSHTHEQGTQSSNPHNDYCQHFVDTGQRPQNFIRDVGLADRFEEYPKLRELIRLKDELIKESATPPMYLQTDLKTFDLKTLGAKFDVILIEPPLEVSSIAFYYGCREYSNNVIVIAGILSWRKCYGRCRSTAAGFLELGRDPSARHQRNRGQSQFRVFVVRQFGRSRHGTELFAQMGIPSMRRHLLDSNQYQ